MADRPKALAEPLEERLMMSAGVTARIQGNTLVVRGDQGDNSVRIFVDAGQVHVIGFNGTVVNEASGKGKGKGKGKAQPTAFDGVENLRIQMRDGNDRVQIGQLSVTGRALIDLGRGDDDLTVTDSTFAGRTKIAAKGGNDRISMGSYLLGPQDLARGQVAFPADLVVHGQQGTDEITCHDVTVAGRTVVHAGTAESGQEGIALGRFGASFEAERLIVIGHSPTTLIMGSMDRRCRPTVVDSVSIRLSSEGRDWVLFRHVEIGGRLHVQTGEGPDVIWVAEGSTIRGPVNIEAGDGRDTVRLENSTFDERVVVDLGGDNDFLKATGSQYHSRAVFRGGDGRADRIETDLLHHAPPSPAVRIDGFEIFL